LTPEEAARAGAGTRGASGFGQKPSDHNGLHLRRQRGSSGAAANGGGVGGDRARPVLLLLAVLAVAGGAIVATKAGFRTARRIRRGPRGVAAACRQELASFLLDQRIETPRSATLGELGEVVRREFGVRPEAFVVAATAARFGPLDSAGAAAATARRELRALLRGARHGLTRWERLRGLLSLRSLARPVAPVGSAAS
jgi:hypothetical protein